METLGRRDFLQSNSYGYPEPGGFADYLGEPVAAFTAPTKSFSFRTRPVRTAANLDRTLVQVLQSTYAAAAELGGWDRAILKDEPHRLPPMAFVTTRRGPTHE
jgi:hypothetical protein